MAFGDLTSIPFEGMIIDTLNEKYPMGTMVKSNDGDTYRIKSQWTREGSSFGAWGRCETKNKTIWITSEEITK